MEFTEVAQKRTSIRQFTEDPIPVEDLKELVRIGGMAPSVNNSQPWKFHVITKKQLLNEMADVVAKKIGSLPENESRISNHIKKQTEWFATFFKEAPALIALTMSNYESVLEKGVSLDHEKINHIRKHPDIQSAGAAVQNILLAAVDMGYGACWMSAPTMAAEKLDDMIQTEKDYETFAFIAVGVPKQHKEPKAKKPVEEIFKLIE
ncbi:MAG: nitroreductase family protein [Bacteroidales bacterium]|nr:nitroreductase family protein [Bacteroidales bacterium]MCF8327885.1 nitroreductase family protein [Bacteroidales bacterium]